MITYLSTQAFLLSVRGFILRKGVPECICSNNACNLDRAAKEVKQIWKMINNEEPTACLAQKGCAGSWVGAFGAICQNSAKEGTRRRDTHFARAAFPHKTLAEKPT